jgi:recombinational DNA repair protein RecT
MTMTTGNQSIARRAPNPLEMWKQELSAEKTTANLAKALAGTGFTPERFAYSAYMVASRNDRLLSADRRQLWLGVYAAAECGLSLQPFMQHMHLVPYGNEVTPITGYQGYVYLTERTGLGVMHRPVLVFQRDVDEGRFHYREGTGGYCWLDPVVKDPRKPKGILRYAFCTYSGTAGDKWACLEREDLLERRELSAGWKAFKSGKRKSSPWDISVDKEGSEVAPKDSGKGGNWLAMSMKTAARDMAKWAPKSTDHWGHRLAKAEAVEAAEDHGEGLSEVLDTTFQMEQAKTANERLKDRLGVEDAQVERELGSDDGEGA